MNDLPAPRLLIIDDLFGRALPDRRNEERANLCGQFLIEDVTGDEAGKGTPQRIKRPVAQAVFHRGQTPLCSRVGDAVENDLEGTLRFISAGWDDARGRQPRWTLVLLDLCFYTGTVTPESDRQTPGMPEGRHGDDDPSQYFGLQLLRAIHERFPELPVVILSSKPRAQVSREFSQHGALAFLPRGIENGVELLRDYIRRHGLIPDETGEIVGHSKVLLMTLRAARRAASDKRNILITGERGTGKELLARYVHRHSTRQQPRPFVTVDSGTLSPQLYSSELFGHKRGAFTGAERDRMGRIQQADGGDLFLDEIGNMPFDVQVALLRALEYRQVTPLGASEGRAVDVRFLSATNEDLEGKAATGGFRQDLLDRLREGGTVFLRPLREREEDIELLVERLVREAERARPGALTREIEPESLALIRSHNWPGNIRELRSCIYNAVLSYPDVEHLQPVHLHIARYEELEEAREAPAGHSRLVPDTPPAAGTLDELIAALARFKADGVGPADLSGRLPALQDAYAGLMAELIRASLLATRKPTLDDLEGEILIHPALKLLSGDKALTASKSADIIKRLLGPYFEGGRAPDADPVLSAAYETALRLRPRKPPRKAEGSNGSA